MINKHSTIHNYRLFCQKRNLKGHRKEGRLGQVFNPLLFQISNVFRLFQERGWSTVDSLFQVALLRIKLQLSGWGRPKLSVAEGSTSYKCAKWAGDGMVKWYRSQISDENLPGPCSQLQSRHSAVLVWHICVQRGCSTFRIHCILSRTKNRTFTLRKLQWNC